MAVKYLLPCSCGEKIVIDVGKAGRTVRCRCGHSVEVPTLREIKKLRQFQQQARDLVGDWNPRRAIALGGAIVAMVAGLTTGWLHLNRPVSPEREVDSQIRRQLERLEDWSFATISEVDSQVARMTVQDAYRHWQMLQSDGLFWLEMQRSGKLTRRQEIIRQLQQDERMVQYRQQEQLHTNFGYIALSVALAAATICGTALFLGRRTVVSGRSMR